MENPRNESEAWDTMKEALEFQEDKAHLDFPKAIRLGRRALTILEQHPNERLQIRVSAVLARNLALNGYLSEAKELAAKAVAKAINARLPLFQAHGLTTLGWVYRIEGDFRDAHRVLTEAIDIYQNHPGDNRGLSRAHNMLGLVYWNISSLDQSMEQYILAEKIGRRIGDELLLAAIGNNIGLIYMDAGDGERALEYFTNSARSFECNGYRTSMGVILLNTGQIWYNRGESQAAMKYALMALENSKRANDMITLGAVYNLLGDTARLQKKYPEALNFFEKALFWRQKCNDSRGGAYGRGSIGRTYMELRNFTKAEASFRTALEICDRYHFSREGADACRFLAACRQNAGAFDEAIAFFKRYIQFDETFSRDNKLKRFSELRLRFDLSKQGEEIRMLRNHKMMEEIRLARNTTVLTSAVISSIIFLLGMAAIYGFYRGEKRLNDSLSREIEAHKRDHRQLREQEDMFRVLVEHSRLAVVVLQEERIVYANPAFCDLSGYTGTELSSIRVKDLVHPEDYTGVLQELWSRRDIVPKTAPTRFRGINRFGETRYVDFYGAYFDWESAPAFLVTLLDVTEQNRVREDLLKTRENESVGPLAGGVAHDFNNCLAVIIGYLYMAREVAARRHHVCKSVGGAMDAAQTLADKVTQFLGSAGDIQY